VKSRHLRNAIAIGVSALLTGSSAYLLWQQLDPQHGPRQPWVMKKRIAAGELPVAELPWTRDANEPVAASIAPAGMPFVERGPIVAWLRPAVLPNLRPKHDLDDPVRLSMKPAEVPWVRGEVRPIKLQVAMVPKLPVRRSIQEPEPAAVTPAAVPWVRHPAEPAEARLDAAAVPSFPAKAEAKAEAKPDGNAVSVPVE
jgi:hypothetical protein